MTFRLHGCHLIAGHRIGTDATFQPDLVNGPSQDFSVGTPALVAKACAAAAEAFSIYGWTSRDQRARLLETIAEEIDLRGEAITHVAQAETGLPEARLVGERGRTTGQLRLFAAHVREGRHLDLRHDAALPERLPAPRPELYLKQRPIGPVAVFGASNFPLAFSTAGGDTAAALAAGCPVVVKGHSAHPGTGEIVAEAIVAAIERCGLPAGVFSLIQGGARNVGEALVQDPHIKAVGFTGSLGGGRALFDLCAARPEPIPFFGELGSINPLFLLPGALAERGAEIARGWAASLTLGAGQFCTNPGLVVLVKGPEAEAFIAQAAEALAKVAPQVMLTPGIAASYGKGCARMAVARVVLAGQASGRAASPGLYRCPEAEWEADPHLQEEVFGPAGLVVTVDTPENLPGFASRLGGQLTCGLHMAASDLPLARRLLPHLETKAGRVLVGGFPTGVEVADAMVHGGPWPASTNFGATSVGTLSIRRFLRPVSYQNLPPELLDADFGVSA